MADNEVVLNQSVRRPGSPGRLRSGTAAERRTMLRTRVRFPSPALRSSASPRASRQLLVAEARRRVVVHEPDCLHERVADGRADEAEPRRLRSLLIAFDSAV